MYINTVTSKPIAASSHHHMYVRIVTSVHGRACLHHHMYIRTVTSVHSIASSHHHMYINTVTSPSTEEQISTIIRTSELLTPSTEEQVRNITCTSELLPSILGSKNGLLSVSILRIYQISKLKYLLQFTSNVIKSKAIPLQTWKSPEGSRSLRITEFKTVGT
jgi:hypothetical protein